MGIRLKHLFAKDSHGNIVTATQAIKGLPYFNVITNAKMILKKIDKFGRYCKSAHFSLIGDQTWEPSLESEEHFVCKSKIVSILKLHIDNRIPFRFSWHCEHCNKEVVGDWMKKAADGMVFHSDRGVQYASEEFRSEIKG